MSVFIIDDDIFYTSIIEKQLQNFGVEVVNSFDNMDNAIKKMHITKPCIIFLDLHLEKVKTLSYFSTIKQKFPNSYLVAMTSSNDEETRNNCKEKGAFYFLDKNKDLHSNIKNILLEVNKYSEFFH